MEEDGTGSLNEEQEVVKLIKWHMAEIVRLEKTHKGIIEKDPIPEAETSFSTIPITPIGARSTLPPVHYAVNGNRLTVNDVLGMRGIMEQRNIPGPYQIEVTERQYEHLRRELIRTQNRDINYTRRRNPNNRITLHGVQINVQENEIPSESHPWPRDQQELRRGSPGPNHARDDQLDCVWYEAGTQSVSQWLEPRPQRGLRPPPRHLRRPDDS